MIAKQMNRMTIANKLNQIISNESNDYRHSGFLPTEASDSPNKIARKERFKQLKARKSGKR